MRSIIFGTYPKVASFCLCENFKGQQKKQSDQESKKNKVTTAQKSKVTRGQKWQGPGVKMTRGIRGPTKKTGSRFPQNSTRSRWWDLSKDLRVGSAQPPWRSQRLGKCWGNVRPFSGGGGEWSVEIWRCFDTKQKHGWHFSQPIQPRTKTLNLYSSDDIMMWESDNMAQLDDK